MLALGLIGVWLFATVRHTRRLLLSVDSVHLSEDGLTISPRGAWTWDQIRSFELDQAFVNIDVDGRRRSIDLQRKRMTPSEWDQFVDALTHHRPDCTASWQEQLRSRKLA